MINQLLDTQKDGVQEVLLKVGKSLKLLKERTLIETS